VDLELELTKRQRFLGLQVGSNEGAKSLELGTLDVNLEKVNVGVP